MKTISKDEIYKDQFGMVKVMAVKDGYVMAKRPLSMPFILSISDFLRLFSEVTE